MLARTTFSMCQMTQIASLSTIKPPVAKTLSNHEKIAIMKSDQEALLKRLIKQESNLLKSAVASVAIPPIAFTAVALYLPEFGMDLSPYINLPVAEKLLPMAWGASSLFALALGFNSRFVSIEADRAKEKIDILNLVHQESTNILLKELPQTSNSTSLAALTQTSTPNFKGKTDNSLTPLLFPIGATAAMFAAATITDKKNEEVAIHENTENQIREPKTHPSEVAKPQTTVEEKRSNE